jgi:ketosteroid isomerase-like protein
MSREQVEIARSAVNALQSEDLDGFLALLHPDIEWHTAADEPDSGVHRGREAVAAMREGWRESFAAFRTESDEPIDAGDAVIVPMRFHARAHGADSWIAVEEFDVIRFRDGKIAEVREYRTAEQAREGLGAS